MQYPSGSGIEHAEGGGTPKGESTHGFQIWVNVPAAHKGKGGVAHTTTWTD